MIVGSCVYDRLSSGALPYRSPPAPAPLRKMMKFTDGFWRIRDGVQISYATQVRDVHIEAKRFTSYAAVKKVTHRGDTLNAPLITAECFSPWRV